VVPRESPNHIAQTLPLKLDAILLRLRARLLTRLWVGNTTPKLLRMGRGYGFETGAIRLCDAVTCFLLAPYCEQSAISNSFRTNQLFYRQTDGHLYYGNGDLSLLHRWQIEYLIVICAWYSRVCD